MAGGSPARRHRPAALGVDDRPLVDRERTPSQVEHEPQCLIDGSEFVSVVENVD
jgi:hypothetical protein